MRKIIVVGSINMDLLFRTNKRPNPGETVSGIEFAQFPGGKGANQAVAASRLGADVTMVGAVGEDEYGKILLNRLKEQGVKTDNIKIVAGSTGLANIVLDGKGENSIITIQGANGKVLPEDINETLFEPDDIVLLQLEIPIDTVYKAAKTAKAKGAIVILDPAPVKELPADIYNYIDIIKPNKGEALAITKTNSIDLAASSLMEKGIKNVIITLGADGTYLYTHKKKQLYPAKKVQVLDTTAAGDSFSGALAKALLENKSLAQGIEFATKAASITVTRLGAQASLPSLGELGGN